MARTAEKLKGDPKGFPCVSLDAEWLDARCQQAADLIEQSLHGDNRGRYSEVAGRLSAQAANLLGMIDRLRHRCAELAIELSTRPRAPGPDESVTYVQELSQTRLTCELIVSGNADVGETRPYVSVAVAGHYEIEGLRRRILAADQWGDGADPKRFALAPTYDPETDVLAFWLEDA